LCIIWGATEVFASPTSFLDPPGLDFGGGGHGLAETARRCGLYGVVKGKGEGLYRRLGRQDLDAAGPEVHVLSREPRSWE
jgi:hypothetical protein